jgi:hypothetical protein
MSILLVRRYFRTLSKLILAHTQLLGIKIDIPNEMEPRFMSEKKNEFWA